MENTLFNNWMADKIASFLKTEGMTAFRNGDNGINTTAIDTTDAFGNRYEIKITLLGRINTNDYNNIAVRQEYSIF